ncbi:hypothetical protein [Bradyrhizobium arachidis]|uniref:Uncharacterized protein n=1 Tax=Bradyrhizobium arachidis TaxID=858423 RepID=A0AAE7NX98_9BRAD|nr:hypothetical protein [Bradyrhizobium arachidis]QOZ73512.1 hypothetical protein WN72_22635 [Bradyrhizobium arachidis]
MYLLTACLVVIVLSAAVSFRRSRSLSRDARGRLAAIWPVFCAGVFALGLIGFERAQGSQGVGPSTTTDLLLLVVSFFSGWFLGALAGWI